MPVSAFCKSLFCIRSECLRSADSVEKHALADAEFYPVTRPQAPLLSGFSRMLRCRKDLGQLPEVLGGCGEEEFVIRTAGST